MNLNHEIFCYHNCLAYRQVPKNLSNPSDQRKLLSHFWNTKSKTKLFYQNGMLRHSFLRVGEDIPLQHILLPQCSFNPPSSYWVALTACLLAWACEGGNKCKKYDYYYFFFFCLLIIRLLTTIKLVRLSAAWNLASRLSLSSTVVWIILERWII